MSTLKHLTEFIDFCNNYRIVCESKICRLFTATFKRRIRGWFKMLPTKSIHSWKHFMELFIDAHEDYNYQKLRYEIRNLRKQEGESTSTFFSRFMSIHFRFHEKDQLSAEEITNLFYILILIQIYMINQIMISFKLTICMLMVASLHRLILIQGLILLIQILTLKLLNINKS